MYRMYPLLARVRKNCWRLIIFIAQMGLKTWRNFSFTRKIVTYPSLLRATYYLPPPPKLSVYTRYWDFITQFARKRHVYRKYIRYLTFAEKSVTYGHWSQVFLVSGIGVPVFLQITSKLHKNSNLTLKLYILCQI